MLSFEQFKSQVKCVHIRTDRHIHIELYVLIYQNIDYQLDFEQPRISMATINAKIDFTYLIINL